MISPPALNKPCTDGFYGRGETSRACWIPVRAEGDVAVG